MADLTEVPHELACEIWSAKGYKTWTWYADRDAAHWAATPYRYNGEQVLMLLDGDDMSLSTRPSIEAAYGPLTEVPHCTRCGSYLFYNGVCCRQA